MLRENIINLCIEEAKRSTYKQKIGAVIFRKKSILSSGHNYINGYRKKLHPRYQKWYGSIHAEIDAIINARADLKKASLLIMRVNNNGELRLAKPCEFCMTYIRHVGIKEVIYSTDSGFCSIRL